MRIAGRLPSAMRRLAVALLIESTRQASLIGTALGRSSVVLTRIVYRMFQRRFDLEPKGLHSVGEDRLSRHRVRVVEGVPRARAQRTPPPAEPAPPDRDQMAPIPHSTHWGRPTPADAEALRGLPAIGRGIGSGAIKGSQPGKNLH